MATDVLGNRLLMIDDELAFGQTIKRIAETSGFEVSVTSDPTAFMNTARQWHPTVIMLDLKMPGVDGIQLLRGLAADKCRASVILTSGADPKILDSAMQLGRERGLDIREALPKPIRAEELRQRLAGYSRASKSELFNDLLVALTTSQLFLEYQPKLDCRLGRITGVEALVRWRHPKRGVIPPDHFIGLAEESDLIHKLTDWVLAEAAKQVARWRISGLHLEAAVNVSARDIEDLDLPERLEGHCRAADIDPALIILELTETGAMREAVQMMDVLTRLRLKGFKLSIDDFGTGYSSLVQLQRMPFSEVKIDCAFVMQMMENHGCRVIVEIIIDLAHKLGLTCIAEGVEDAATLTRLIELGCDTAQGYHLSRPIAAEQMAQFIAEFVAGSNRNTGKPASSVVKCHGNS